VPDSNDQPLELLLLSSRVLTLSKLLSSLVLILEAVVLSIERALFGLGVSTLVGVIMSC